MHPVSHLTSHSAAPHSEHAITAVHHTLQLDCLAVIVLEAVEPTQQHTRHPAANCSMVTCLRWLQQQFCSGTNPAFFELQKSWRM